MSRWNINFYTPLLLCRGISRILQVYKFWGTLQRRCRGVTIVHEYNRSHPLHSSRFPASGSIQDSPIRRHLGITWIYRYFVVFNEPLDVQRRPLDLLGPPCDGDANAVQDNMTRIGSMGGKGGERERGREREEPGVSFKGAVQRNHPLLTFSFSFFLSSFLSSCVLLPFSSSGSFANLFEI